MSLDDKTAATGGNRGLGSGLVDKAVLVTGTAPRTDSGRSRFF